MKPDSMCRAAVVALGVLICLLLAGCGGAPAVQPDLPVRVTVKAAADVNPDLQSRPSAVAVVVLQLKSADSLLKADFFAAYDPAGKAYGADLVAREQVTVMPGESRDLKFDLRPETNYLAVVAAYRDIEHATWRATLEVPAKRKPGTAGRATVTVGASQASMAWTKS